MRNMFLDFSSLPLPKVYGISALGTRFSVYEYHSDTRILTPELILPDLDVVSDIAPQDRWNYDVMTPEGEAKFKQIAGEIKKMAAALSGNLYTPLHNTNQKFLNGQGLFISSSSSPSVAKHRLWIVDYSNTCEPIMRFLLDRRLVVEPSAACNPLESFANESNESNSGEWSEEGNRLLNHREYEEPIMAFDNAGDIYMAAVATAYQSREVARDISGKELDEVEVMKRRTSVDRYRPVVSDDDRKSWGCSN
ncbi:hypothetical protein V8E52_003252, partial [Russula decolorans]